MLPTALPKVQVTIGPWGDFAGVAGGGQVFFKPSTMIRYIPTGQPLLPSTVAVTLDATGAGSVTLPATDAADCTAINWTYLVSFALKSGGEKAQIQPFNIALPQGVSVVDLDALVPVQSSVGTTVSVPVVNSVAGLTGPVQADELSALLGGIFGVVISGTPVAGYVLTATSSTTATWQAPTGGSGSFLLGGLMPFTIGS